jgi:hypothetical protein
MATLKRQFITDTEGKPIGVILPIDEYALVEALLEAPKEDAAEAEKLEQMKRASKDPLFMEDLQAAMADFSEADAEWWEPGE